MQQFRDTRGWIINEAHAGVLERASSISRRTISIVRNLPRNVLLPRCVVLIECNFSSVKRAGKIDTTTTTTTTSTTSLSLLSINYRLVYTSRKGERLRHLHQRATAPTPSYRKTCPRSLHVSHIYVRLDQHVGPTTTRSNDGRVRRRRKRPLMSIACGSPSCIGASFDGKKKKITIVSNNLESFPTFQGRRVCSAISAVCHQSAMRKLLEIKFTVSSLRSCVCSACETYYYYVEIQI